MGEMSLLWERIDLGGEKSGHDFGFDVENNWWFKSNNSTQFTVEQNQAFLDDEDNITGAFRVNAYQKISYSSITKGNLPILPASSNHGVSWCELKAALIVICMVRI